MQVEGAARYSAHAFRRGAAMELKRAESALAHVSRTAGRNSATSRACLPLVEDEYANTRLILMDRAGESTEEEDYIPPPEMGAEWGPSPVGAGSSSVSSTSGSL